MLTPIERQILQHLQSGQTAEITPRTNTIGMACRSLESQGLLAISKGGFKITPAGLHADAREPTDPGLKGS